MAHAQTPLAPAARRDLYALSARLLSEEIDAPLFRALTSSQMDALQLSFIEPHLRQKDEADALEDLAVEYCRLFIGPLPECVPYESSQREDALLGGRSRKKLDEFMARNGLHFEGGTGVASVDHVSVELSILAQLYAVAADETAAEHERKAAMGAVHELLREHLLPWAPRFFAHLEASARQAVYRTVAALTSQLLEEERELHGL